MIIPPVSPPIRLRRGNGAALGSTSTSVQARLPRTTKVGAAAASATVECDARDIVPLLKVVVKDSPAYTVGKQGMDADAKTGVVFDADFPPVTYCGLDGEMDKNVPRLIPSCNIVSFDEQDGFNYPLLVSSTSDSDSDSGLPELIPRRDDSDSDSDLPELIPRRDLFVSSESDSDSDSDLPELIPGRDVVGLDRQDVHADIYPRGANRPIGDGDLGMLLRLEELIVSFREKKDCGRQSASSKNDRKPTATASGVTAEKKSTTTSKFDTIRKKLEEKGKKKLESNSATPQVSIDSTSAAVQDRADKVFTMGTECNAIIAWVAKHKNVNAPAYTRPFYQRLKDDEPLRTNCKISLLALRRSPTSGSTFWSTSQWNRDQTREYTLNWQLYIRYLEAHEPNTSEFRMAWGKSLTEILNRFGAGYPIPQKNRYEADLGKGVFGDYCTYPITYKRIEETYFPLRFSNEDIAEDTDLLNLYFGENEEDVERARDWYKTRCGLNTQVVQAQAAEVEDLTDIAKNIF